MDYDVSRFRRRGKTLLVRCLRCGLTVMLGRETMCANGHPVEFGAIPDCPGQMRLWSP